MLETHNGALFVQLIPFQKVKETISGALIRFLLDIKGSSKTYLCYAEAICFQVHLVSSVDSANFLLKTCEPPLKEPKPWASGGTKSSSGGPSQGPGLKMQPIKKAIEAADSHDLVLMLDTFHGIPFRGS